MPKRRTRASRSLATRSTQLALAVPQVIAHRVARMAMAGAAPSSRDRREFSRMTLEKPLAFGEAWTAMALQSMLAQQAFALSLLRSLWSPWTWRTAPGRFAARSDRALLDVLGRGLAPLHRTATANARRLARLR